MARPVLPTDELDADGSPLAQLGDVQVSHPLDLDMSPGSNQSGDPALVYNSSLVSVKPIVQATLQTDTAAALPATLSATLTWNDAMPRQLQGIGGHPRRQGLAHFRGCPEEAIRRHCDQLRRECTRQQTLVRAAQRSIGLAPPTPPTRPPERGSKKRRPRRATARALRAAAKLKETDRPPDVTATPAAAESA
jgi:hypothetical protein